MMAMHVLPAAAYVQKLWKNGQGRTDEIYLGPEGSTRDAFDLRISRATLEMQAAFSPFQGAERTITLVEGSGLTLDFGHRSERLAPWESLTFDSGLTPTGLPEGRVRVVNVMAARSVWRLASACLVRTDTEVTPVAGGLAVMYVIQGSARLVDDACGLRLAAGDSLMIDGMARILPESGAVALLIPLHPAGRPLSSCGPM